MQSLGFRLRLDQAGARHHQRLLHRCGDLAAPCDLGGGAKVFDPRIRAGADEHAVEPDRGDRLVGLQAHVLQRASDRVLFGRIRFAIGIGHALVNRQHHLRRRPPADLRLDVLGAQFDDGVELRIVVGDQVGPRRHRRVPVRPLRCERTPAHVVDGLLVHRDHADARAGLDRHVADRHPPFHRQRADRGAGEFQRMAIATGSTDLADDRQHHILGGDAERQRALDPHLHVLHLLGDQALRGQHMLDLRRSDAVRQRAERAMRGRVRIAADHGHARQRGALLRADHVDDALAHVVHPEFEDAEVVAVLVQRLYLQPRDGIRDRLQATVALDLRRRHVVVGRGDVGVDPPRLAAGQAQALERLRRGHLVEDVAVDVEQRRSIIAAHDFVHLPQFVVQGLAGHALPRSGLAAGLHPTSTRRLEAHPADLPSITPMAIFHPFDSRMES